MKNKPSVLNQPNVITQARYLFSDTEMKVLVFIIKNIQLLLNREGFEHNRTLFGEIDYKIFFHLNDIDEKETNLKRIKTAIKSLRQKDFEIDDGKRWLNVGLINYGEYQYDVKKWELQVSHKLMPYMVDIAKGYTEYQLQTILQLNKHAQRLYMMFSQFHGTGVFNINAEELRFKLALEDKYKKYRDFKNWVIIPAIEDINKLFEQGRSDVCITLKSDKKPRGNEDFDRTLEFRIAYTKRVYKQIEVEKEQYLRYTMNLLRSIFPNDDKYCNKLIGHLVQNKRLKPFGDRLKRIEDEAIETQNSLSYYGGLVRTIAKNDHNFYND
ncbi:replication initiation protein [Sphingobacterium phlebotomi]|uniref:Replication initiation protein n=1 Tax=Sphingobacterium phlebotomi TaxID=2605433 RepID=A0A5D4GPN3_9SPHI|nr:replication initiation protein [Sphingobacterium phlebotomi]TYR30811.1 replication initiation protein [Sphingobacterium phlebotomi]